MNCDTAELMLAAVAVDSLDDGDSRSLRRHLRDCAGCRAAASGFQRAADLLPLSIDTVQPPPELRSRVLAAVHAEAAGHRAVEARRGRGRRLWDRVPSGRGFTVAGALGTALASVAAALAVGVARPTAVTAPVASTATFHACGLTSQPYACGTLTVDPAIKQAYLTVTGLTPIPAVGGQPVGTYEVWLIDRNRTAVPAAFLAAQPGGTTWSASMQGDMSKYVAVAMTREPVGGSPTPSDTEVLRLTLVAGA